MADSCALFLPTFPTTLPTGGIADEGVSSPTKIADFKQKTRVLTNKNNLPPFLSAFLLPFGV
jgi:hypothetical protein